VITIPIAAAVLPTSGIRSYLYQRNDTHKHRGIDLPAHEGAPVLAAAGGTVTHAHSVYAPGFGGYGRVVVLEHPGHFWTLYAHLSDVQVRKGQRVVSGDLLGSAGRTAFTAAEPDHLMPEGSSHLHFEVSARPYPLVKESPRLDPVAWLNTYRGGGSVAGGIALVGLGLGWLYLRSRGLS
jgi:murein DD-endopeptidase MepM/ murein hydrolase activator NlpD